MAQSGVLWVPRIQLIRGFVHTMTMIDLSASGRERIAQVSFTAGRAVRWKLIPGFAPIDITGPIYAFDAAVQVGTWEVRLEPAPEPGSLVLLCSALAGFGVIRRRRKPA
jgi:hypothetical protein